MQCTVNSDAIARGAGGWRVRGGAIRGRRVRVSGGQLIGGRVRSRGRVAGRLDADAQRDAAAALRVVDAAQRRHQFAASRVYVQVARCEENAQR